MRRQNLRNENRWECKYAEYRSSIVKEEIPIVTICRLLFGQAEELRESLLRLDFGGGGPYVPHLEMNGSGCSDIDEVKAIGSTSAALGPVFLTVQVEFCVFQDVVREARGHGEFRTVPRTGSRLEVDSAIKVTR